MQKISKDAKFTLLFSFSEIIEFILSSFALKLIFFLPSDFLSSIENSISLTGTIGSGLKFLIKYFFFFLIA